MVRLVLNPETSPDGWSDPWELEFTLFLVRASCDASGFVQLGDKFSGRQVSKRGMRPGFVVVSSPVVDPGSGIIHGKEP